MGKLMVGWSEVSITPDNKRISLAGQFAERISEYVETPVTVTALAVESDGESLIMCSCDLVSIGKALVKDVRDIVAKECPEIDTDKIIISATHTHTSFVYNRKESQTMGSTKEILNRFLPEEKQYVPKAVLKGDDVMTPAQAADFLAERIAKAVLDAWNSRKAGKYAQGFGRAAIGMNRRVCYSDGSAKMWGDVNTATFTELEGGNDSGIEMLFFYDENEKITGAAINVCCPSQIVEHRHFISSDYWGKVKILLREQYGEDFFVLALGGPGGDQCPRDLIRWVNGETPVDDPNIERPDYIERIADPSMFDIKGTWKAGKRIAREVIDAIEEVTATYDEALLKHNKYIIDLPLRRVTPNEYEMAVEAMEKFASKVTDHVNFVDNAKMHVHAGTILRYERQHKQNIVPYEIHIARLGNMAIATNPFELFLDFGNQIRARSRAKQTILVQLACDSGSYLPTAKAEKGGHYSAYVTSGKVGHEGGDMLVRKSVEEINKMFE
ncbi:MAG: hypothetical protein J6A69_04010 [Clostridia bacterium]|nr:hypothetical protein [Clostridia bacterium]